MGFVRSPDECTSSAIRRSLKRCVLAATSARRVAVLLMGLPGSGKSAIIAERFSELDVVSPDALKSASRREHGESEHRRSVRHAVDVYVAGLETGRSVVLDSTGSNALWLADRVEEARESGYDVHLYYVSVPVAIALYRNRNRSACGGCWIPEEVILDKAKVMSDSFEECSRMVDYAATIENFSDGMELRMAELDLYLYPAPRDHAGLRPWQRGYGDPVGTTCPANRQTRRTLRLGCWRRSKSCLARKEARMDELDALYPSREEFIDKEVLCGQAWLLEENKYPYLLPEGVEHHTLWASEAHTHAEVVEWVEAYLDSRRPDVVAWNYDQNNAKRTIDTFHVHIYLCTRRNVVDRLAMADSPRALDRRDDGGGTAFTLEWDAPGTRRSSRSRSRSKSTKRKGDRFARPLKSRRMR